MPDTVADLMTTELATAAPDTTVEEVAILMRDVDAGSIPIVEDGRLVGIVTDRDIVVRCVAEGNDCSATPVHSIMTADPITLRLHDDPDGALAMMRDHRIRRLPVLDADGRLAGLLPIGKLARHSENAPAGEALRGISEPG